MSTESKDPFAYWAILELLGHRRLAGYVQEAQIAGASFLRIDVHKTARTAKEQDGVFTQFYSPAAVYAITPTSEAIARQISGEQEYQPVSPWELRTRAPMLDVGDGDER